MRRRRRARRVSPIALVTVVASLLTACLAASGNPATLAEIPGYQPGSATPTAPIQGYGATTQPTVTASLGETDATHMFIHLSQTFAPGGKVSFLVSNDGTKTHEFVVLATDTPAASFPIVSFEGEANRIDEDAKGVTNVGETGDMEVGTAQMLTLDLPPGHYAVVCNLPGHYAMGMHQDFWVTG